MLLLRNDQVQHRFDSVQLYNRTTGHTCIGYWVFDADIKCWGKGLVLFCLELSLFSFGTYGPLANGGRNEKVEAIIAG